MIRQNLEAVRCQIKSALASSGRAEGSAELLAVSKTFPAGDVREAALAGQVIFGESRVQELLAKVAAPEIPSVVDWHFIGHLQKNKIRKLLPHCSTLHSIDSLELAQNIDRIAAEEGVFPDIYLEVNVAGDPSKFGFTPTSVRAALDDLLLLERVGVVGLMTIPPLVPDPELSRRHFAALRELRDDLAERAGIPLPGLSMGMSSDFAIAIAEGATVVRVGSQIFGSRPRQPPAP